MDKPVSDLKALARFQRSCGGRPARVQHGALYIRRGKSGFTLGRADRAHEIAIGGNEGFAQLMDAVAEAADRWYR